MNFDVAYTTAIYSIYQINFENHYFKTTLIHFPFVAKILRALSTFSNESVISPYIIKVFSFLARPLLALKYL